jgi:hypothetical protein
MRSLPRSLKAGNLKLRGKLSRLMGCGCCVAQNFKPTEEVKLAEQEIHNYIKYLEKIDGEVLFNEDVRE